jgi:hypothetical protein
MKGTTVKPGRATRTAQPGRMLTQVAGAQQTGTLVVEGSPGGNLHLVQGHVTYAESPAAPGVGELLTASGRLAPRTWEAALEAGSATGEVGRLLVDQGHLTQGELELCVLGAIHDAAYFVLQPASAPVEFVENAPHWLGTVIRVDAAAVGREARRRGRLLDEIFPHPEIDTAPVTPVARPPVERVALTSLQWELLVHADGQRTPADLAQLLGRAGYATIQELRRLAGQGLLELPAGTEPTDRPRFVRLPRGGGPYADRERPTVTVPPAAGAVPVVPVAPVDADGADTERSAGTPSAASGPPDGSAEPDAPATDAAAAAPVGAATSTGAGPDRPPRLPRRKPNARLPKGIAPADANTPVHHGADEVLLKRIRTALRALR